MTKVVRVKGYERFPNAKKKILKVIGMNWETKTPFLRVGEYMIFKDKDFTKMFAYVSYTHATTCGGFNWKEEDR